MSLSALFALKWFMQRRSWDFPSFRWLWQGGAFLTTGSVAAFSGLNFFFPLPSFFLGEEILLEVEQIIIKKPQKPLQTVSWWGWKDQMTQFLLLMWWWHQICAQHHDLSVRVERSFFRAGKFESLLCGCRCEGQRWTRHTPVHLPSLVSDTVLFRGAFWLSRALKITL